ncbi:hypothetical protein F4823DRAFT_630084 [Ustulina deusta]|nr:hypothetical protein F4823DRAFT_630084 [Ustulina deusta]
MQARVGLSHSVAVGRDDFSSLLISFMRTVRVQGGQSCLPPRGLGTFHLLNTQPYRNQLPPKAVALGGLFLPMYESEAMYITFDCQASDKFVVRPFLGGVNGISGKRLYSTESAKSAALRKQDYIVTSEQHRLDGVSVRPGVVNQFVAMKINLEPKKEEVAGDRPEADQGPENGEVPEPRKGGTVEWQMTGNDEAGGIQLQIILYGVLESYQPVPDDSVVYDVFKTPEELGLSEGDFIHVREFESRPIPAWEPFRSKSQRITYKGVDREEARGKKVADLAAESPFPSDTLELEVVHNQLRERIITVRGANTDKEPLRFRIDADDDFSDIQAAARDVFGMPDGELFASGLVVNNPDILFPINDWSDYLFATEPAVSYNEFWKPRNFDHLSLGSGGESVTKEFDLVLVCINGGPVANKPVYLGDTDKWRNVCHLNFLNGADKHFSNISKPLMLEISHDSTLADVRRLIQETTGSSTEGFRFASLDSADVPDNCIIYGDHFGLAGTGLTLELHILQEICADTSNPRIWDVGSSKILYVHIVNSRDFEDIMGLPPPDTLVTWKLYAKLQLPYDRAWKQQQGDPILDVKGKGVSSDGIFDRLVSLEENRVAQALIEPDVMHSVLA